MELRSMKPVNVSIDNAYINRDIVDILREMYIKRVKNKILQVYIICYLYERAQN